jgi:integrase
MGLGNYPVVTLAMARAKVLEQQRLLANGTDPIGHKRSQRHSRVTFSEACEEWSTANKWRSEREVNLLLRVYGKPLSNISVATIDASMIEAALKPVWERAPSQVRRALSVWEKVFAYAKFKNWRNGDNPAAWLGNMQYLFPAPPNADRKHLAAMPYADVPDFIKRLRIREIRAASAAALEFVILTACRSGEALGAQWSEIDFENRIWTIPAERMKAKREHRVPLSNRAMELLARQKEYSTSEQYVFTGYNRAALDNKSMRMLLWGMGVKVTVHGFRSTFRNWAAEKTDFDFHLLEMCLAHQVGSAVVRAYLRSDGLEKRRVIMQESAAFCGE